MEPSTPQWYAIGVEALAPRRAFLAPAHPAWSWRTHLTARVLRSLASGVSRAEPHVLRRRLELLASLTPPIPGVRRERAKLGGVPGEWFHPVHGPKPRGVLFHVHGGGFLLCSARTHRMMLADLALHTQLTTFAPEYRLAPEHPFPAPLDDVERAYLGLLDSGIPPQDIVLGGDSAGGNLALGLLQRLRAKGAPLPRQTLLISPWVDLGNGGESVDANHRYDYVNRSVLDTFRGHYLAAGGDVTDPEVSPARMDFRGLPPIFVQAGGLEVLRSQIEGMAARARADGVDVQLQIWPGMVHAWHGFTALFPQATDAFRALGRGVRV